jgi:hypothetical protein
MGLTRAWMMAGAILVAATAPSGRAAIRTATPETLAEAVRRAESGDAITLAPGDYRSIRISRCHFDPAITLDATKATFYGLSFSDCDGVTLRGGEFRLPPPVVKASTGELVQGMALRFDRSSHVVVQSGSFVGPGHPDTGDGFAYGEGKGFFASQGEDVVVEDSSFIGFEAGVVFDRIDNFRVSRITSTAMRSDGVDMAESHHGLVEYVQCSGTVIRYREHPDCIQGWSQKRSTPMSDIVVRHNSAVGDTDGIGFFKGNDQGGYDRITIEDNDIEVSFPAGIVLDDGRDSIVRRNNVRTFGNARNIANLRVTGAGAIVCDNVVGPGAGKPGFRDEKCKSP